DGFGEDGSTQANYWLTTNGATGAYLQLDLGAVFTIDRIRLLNTRNAWYYDRSTADFHLSVSTDGANFTDVYSGTLTEDDIVHWYTAPLTPVEARYVRFYVDSYYGLGGGLAEIEVYPAMDPTFVGMTADGDSYSAMIPATGGTDWVFYRITANDTWGHTTTTKWYHYIADDEPPEVISVSAIPRTPSSGASMDITTLCSDNVGVRNYTLHYSTDGTHYTAVDFTHRTDITDIDLDDKPELIAGTYYGTYVFNETYAVEHDLDDDVWSSWSWGSAVVAGDTDLDGEANLVVADADTSGMLARVYRYNGTGYERQADLGRELDQIDDGAVYTIDIGDVDGNGVPDIVIAVYWPQILYVYEWTGFDYALKHTISLTRRMQTLRLVNMDDDPQEEILCADWESLFAFDISGGEMIQTWSSPYLDVEAFGVADIDGDRLPEAIVGTYNGLNVYQIGPDGIALEMSVDIPGNYVNPSGVMDWDDDGDLEFVICAYDGAHWNATQGVWLYYYNLTVYSYVNESILTGGRLVPEMRHPLVSRGWFYGRPPVWGDLDLDGEV
ncbi:MAG TPA: hypothetical protein EYP43_03155, partial [Thermoplasmata archaeon]|nr:hypothetical protein [Thermoplasmata archaeon]